MQLFGDKRLGIGLLVVMVVLGIWWLKQPRDLIKQQDLLSKIQGGYTQQFCGVIFPRIAGCVSITAEKCPNLVAKHLDACLLQLKLDLPTAVTAAEGKVIYDKVGECFQKDIHDDLTTNFMANTEECRQRLS